MLDCHIVKQRRDLMVDATIKLEDAGCLALFGASGSGKSTILSCIAGIEQPDGGHVRFNDAQFFPPSMPLHVRSTGYLTQDPHLFPHLTVERNVTFGGGASIGWFERLRQDLNLAGIWHAPASRISGGQARRVSVARMMARRPPLVLLDEPFTGLDRQLVRELIQALLTWKAEIGFSMIVVDHECEILERLCSRVAIVSNGRIVQDGSWSEIRSAPHDEALGDLLKPL
jgi:ABC-type sulfate/molybdate transport systems ATPase subunit